MSSGPVVMLARGFIHRCPACGGGHVIVRWFRIVERCPTCDLRFERIEGHQIGYIGLNTVVTFGSTFLVLLVGSLLMIPDVRAMPLLVAALVTSVVLPIALLPSCRGMWTAIDIALRPLRPHEANARSVNRATEPD